MCYCVCEKQFTLIRPIFEQLHACHKSQKWLAINVIIGAFAYHPQGAPDLTVQLVKDPHIYLVIGEVLSAHTHKPVCYICDCSRGNVYSISQIREINVYRRPSE